MYFETQQKIAKVLPEILKFLFL